MNHYEKIMGMSMEELADLIRLNSYFSCSGCPAKDDCDCSKSCEETIIEWLKKEDK